MDTVQIIVIIILCAAAMSASAALYLRQQTRRKLPEEYDMMEEREFVRYCSEILRRNGFRSVQQTEDDGCGADILAEKDGVTYAIRCRCCEEPVGADVLQEACAGREYFGRMVGAVLANRYFSPQAAAAAEKLRILLWDREWLRGMAEGSAALASWTDPSAAAGNSEKSFDEM